MRKNMYRWLVVVGAVVIQLCLGAIYAWSIFVNPLKNQFGFTTTQTQVVFAVGLASFSFIMILAGRWQDKAGPKIVAVTGGILLGLGYFLASFTNGSFYGILLTIGVIAGSGIGFAYVCPIAALIKWFPDMRGFITGLAVAGFGAGAWLFAQLSTSFIDSKGVMGTFFYLGIIFFVSTLAGSIFMVNPPKDWKPKGWQPQNQADKKEAKDFNWKQMVKTGRFVKIWIMFMFGATAGLMVIGNLKTFGIACGLSSAVTSSAVGVLAIFNGVGRVVWGLVSDKLGRTRAMFLMFVSQCVIMLMLPKLGSSALLLTVASAWIGFNFGGNFALFPSLTADFFGTKFVGVNYGLVFTSYGIAGIFGPIFGGKVFDLTGNYVVAFITASVLCLIAAIVANSIKSVTS
ncbi:OFA family MFS transporter [bacterium]|nr:OFA family MFS transporter [bacterium]